MRLHYGLIAALSFGAAASALAEPTIGEAAPAVEANQWYNLPPGIKSLLPEHLKGKLVMVEFWATW